MFLISSNKYRFLQSYVQYPKSNIAIDIFVRINISIILMFLKKKPLCGKCENVVLCENLSENLGYFPQFVTCVTKLYLPTGSPKRTGQSLYYLSTIHHPCRQPSFKRREGHTSCGEKSPHDRSSCGHVGKISTWQIIMWKNSPHGRLSCGKISPHEKWGNVEK